MKLNRPARNVRSRINFCVAFVVSVLIRDYKARQRSSIGCRHSELEITKVANCDGKCKSYLDEKIALRFVQAPSHFNASGWMIVFGQL